MRKGSSFFDREFPEGGERFSQRTILVVKRKRGWVGVALGGGGGVLSSTIRETLSASRVLYIVSSNLRAA